jgi:SAM-dependent methyltransferase
MAYPDRVVQSVKVERDARAEEREPLNVLCRRFLLEGACAGERALDVGCGKGELVKELRALGCDAVGVEIDPGEIAICRAAGLDVDQGAAEALPYRSASFDRIVSSVVLPYTDERRAVGELSRVLKPGGHLRVTCHGVGYAMHFMLVGPGPKRFYGGRMLVNTALYRATGRRIPGPMGDAICQSGRRLARYYTSAGLRLERELWVGAYAGSARFLCHHVTKPA